MADSIPTFASQKLALRPSASAQHGATGRNNEKNAEEGDHDNAGEGKELSLKQWAALPLLLQGRSDAEIGQQMGVDRGTVFRWRKDERFVEELERVRLLLIRGTIARVQGMMDPVLDIVQRQLNSDDPKIALRAAAMLLRIAMPARMERASKPSPPPPEPEEPSFMDQIEAYINAPLPNEPGHPAYEEYLKLRQKSRDGAMNPKGGREEDSSSR